MYHPAPISPASNASFFHLSPSLQPQSNPAREDSSVEPRALKRACWPKSPIQHTPSPARRLPRSFTAPPSSFAALQQPRSFESGTPSLFDDPRPVQLSPALTPSMRSALPQPKPLRPQPPPLQSDLSAASTRAANEPLAVRDLRRVTAPPALMDPWQYDRVNRQRDRDRDRKRFAKSASATSAVTVRADTARDKAAIIAEQRRWRGTGGRVPHMQGKFSRKNWFRSDDLAPLRIPDRFHDSFGDHDGTNSHNDDSVISAITGESDPAEDNNHDNDNQPRFRAQSEMLVRRSSFAVGKDKVISLWDRLRGRRRAAQQNRHFGTETPTAPQRPDKNRTKDRERRSKFSIFRAVEIGLGSHGER